MLKIKKHQFEFLKPAKTSRGEYLTKPHYVLTYTNNNAEYQAEIACLPDLSLDANADFENEIALIAQYNILQIKAHSKLVTNKLPALSFALDCIVSQATLEQSNFKQGLKIPINGLVWMSTTEAMLEEAIKKAELGYQCIKFKVGSHAHNKEVKLIETFTKLFPKVSIRLDANGAYSVNDVKQKLTDFAIFPVHSIEQPIATGNWIAMQSLVKQAIIPIALDEELITDLNTQLKAIETIKPNFIVLKPTLHGGLERCNTLITFATNLGINWWATSALEGNIGLQAIADWVSNYDLTLEQGLGTGLLYKHNFESNMHLSPPFLHYVAS